MMSRRSNDQHMTGRALDVSDAYPWQDMQPGDWFTARCYAASIASIQNKRGSAVYGAVTKDNQNIVVRIK
jgi:hypothetical protein